MNLLEELSKAAARGVEVTILTNDHPPIALTLKWEFKDFNWGATGHFRGAGYDLHVVDEDGDSSWWVLKRGKTVIAKGGTHDWKPYYHFDQCLLDAEAALRAEVARRRAELRGRL